MSDLMKFLNFKQFLLETNKLIIESKQVGILYHITSPDALWSILSQDKLKTFTKKVSFTRNKHYKQITGKDEFSAIIFKIDGNKLSTKYKISPHLDTKSGYGHDNEAEEVVIGEIKDLNKYLISIEIVSKISPENQNALKDYLVKHKHVKIESKYDLPDVVVNAEIYNSIEGYWWKDKVYKPKEFYKTHPMFEDWDDTDLGALQVNAMLPEDAIPNGCVYVNLNFTDKIKFIYVHYNKDDKILASSVGRKIKKRFKDLEVKLMEVEYEN